MLFLGKIVSGKLSGRIWAGHNILRFDCARIREAFAEIGRPAPEPKGSIDSLALLTQRFGRRAGDMKMATLATYFGLGQQTHRSLDDVRMNLEVLKYCATVLFLVCLICGNRMEMKESSLPDIFTTNSWVSPNAVTRSRSNGKASPVGMNLNMSTPSSSIKFENHSISSPSTHSSMEGILNLVEPNTNRPDPFNLGALSSEIERESLKPDYALEEKPVTESLEMLSTTTASQDCCDYAGFLDPAEVSVASISASFVPLYRGTRRMQILHNDVKLLLHCTQLRVRFGISTRFVDPAGRPRLSFVVDGSPSLCQVLDACDQLAYKLSVDSGSSSEWRPVVIRKTGSLAFAFPFSIDVQELQDAEENVAFLLIGLLCSLHSPSLQNPVLLLWPLLALGTNVSINFIIPTVTNGDIAIYATEIYQKDPSGTTQRLIFSRFDAAELDTLFVPGTLVDTYFALDPYDYQQNAGIKLVAKKLIIHGK
ncbi:Protein NEN2 [Vitis vinifera]|uniref:Protein NEN2 n=1 Tax=Vitis vinifera TaxID=29760 RepID=A0A438I177_VITVI|nr:Protein NEN2 [Vitis vinifera]